MVRTYHGLFKPGKNLTAIAGNKETHDHILKTLEKNLRRNAGGDWVFDSPGGTGLGNAMRTRFRRARQAMHIGRVPWPKDEAEQKRNHSVISAEISRLLDSGGPEVNLYNRQVLLFAYDAFRFYRALRKPVDLALFKQFMWGLVTYQLCFPGGASYISDCDFVLGDLIRAWSQLETESVFCESERLVITNVLLAMVRQVYRYKEAFWPTPSGYLRHNHETFKSLTLFWGWAYFRHSRTAREASKWLRVARQCFSGPIGKVAKNSENALGYQPAVPLHKLTFDLAFGKREIVRNGTLRRIAESLVPCIDNFGNGVDYGDTGFPIKNGRAFLPLVSAATQLYNDPRLAWLVGFVKAQIDDRQIPLEFSPFGQVSTRPGSPPTFGVWERVPLERHIVRRSKSRLPQRFVADKIAFRTGWNPDDQYLLFEPYSCDSHCHFDMNAILRYNHKGRIWLIDNAYGKRCGVTNSIEAFGGRQRGPQDHNTVIFRDRDGNAIIPPPCCALVTEKKAGPVLLLQSALCGISGSHWLRTLVIRSDEYLLILDQITAGKGLSRIECQFNGLGNALLSRDSWVLEQKGKKLVLEYDFPGQANCTTFKVAGWQQVLKGGIYPYAKPPIRKLSQNVDNPAPGQRIVFANLIHCPGPEKSRLHKTGNGLTIRKGSGHSPGNIASANIEIRSKNGNDEIILQDKWNIPANISPRYFGKCGDVKMIRRVT